MFGNISYQLTGPSASVTLGALAFALLLLILTFYSLKKLASAAKSDLRHYLATDLNDRHNRRLASLVVATRAVFQQIDSRPNTEIVSDITISQSFSQVDTAEDLRGWRAEHPNWNAGLCIAKVFHTEASRENVCSYDVDRDVELLTEFVGEIAWDHFGPRTQLSLHTQSNAEKLLMYIWRCDLSKWLLQFSIENLPKRQLPSLFDASYRVQTLYATLAKFIEQHRSTIESLADTIHHSTPNIERSTDGQRFYVTYCTSLATLHRLIEESKPSTRPATPPPTTTATT